MNKNFGKLDSNNQIIYAPSSLTIDGYYVHNPLPQTYFRAGWFRIIDQMPENAPENKHYEARGWKYVLPHEIHRVYELVDDPQPTPSDTIYSKYKLINKLIELGKWQQVKEYLIEQSNIYDLFQAATVLTDSNPYFKAAIDFFKEAFSYTDDDVAEILSQCIADDILM